MGNLIRPRLKFLANTKAQLKKIGLYEDDVADREVLVVKDIGLEIPGTTVDGSAIPDFLTPRKLSANAGVKGAYAIEVKPSYPNNTEDFEWGIKVMRKPKRNGFANEEIEKIDYYSDVINFLASEASGYLAVADRNTLVSNIVSAISNDSLSKVIAGKATKITVTDGSETITIDSTGYGAIDEGTVSGNQDQLVSLINAGTQAVAYEGSGTGEVWIIQKGTNLAVTDGGTWTNNSGSLTTGNIYLGIIAKDVNDKVLVFTEEENNITTIKTPSWPYLTWEDIAREFPVQSQDHGSLPRSPIEGETYVKYSFDWVMDTPGLSGASGIERRKNGIDIYVVASLVDDDIYDASDYMDEDNSTEDNTFEELLTEWTGVAVSSW